MDSFEQKITRENPVDLFSNNNNNNSSPSGISGKNLDFFKLIEFFDQAMKEIPVISEGAARELEKTQKGIWATLSECAKALHISKQSFFKKIKKNPKKYHITTKKTFAQKKYLVWVTNPAVIESILKSRYKKQKKQLLRVIITRADLFDLRDMGVISQETFDTYIKAEHMYHQVDIVIPKNIVNVLWKKSNILEINHVRPDLQRI